MEKAKGAMLGLILVLLSVLALLLGIIDTKKSVVAGLHEIGIPEVCLVVDEAAGVACWIYDSPNGGAGISCLPLSETKLQEAGSKRQEE